MFNVKFINFICAFLTQNEQSAFSSSGISTFFWASLVAQLVKNLPAVRKTWVPSLGWEDPLEKGKATHSRILAWRSPQTV